MPRANLTLRRVPEGMSDEVALFAGDVMGTGYHAVAHAGMRAGDTVAVLGLGPVGLCAVQAALAGGADAGLRDRLGRGSGWRWRRSFGADAAAPRPRRSRSARCAAATEGRGVDVVVDAVGDPGPLAMAISLARDAGTVSGIGAYAGQGEVPLGPRLAEGADAAARPRQRDRPRRPRAGLIEAGKLDPSPLVTHHMKLDEAAEAYALYDQPRSAEDRPHALRASGGFHLRTWGPRESRKSDVHRTAAHL